VAYLSIELWHQSPTFALLSSMAWLAWLENKLLQLRLDDSLVDEVLPNKEDDNEEDEEVEEPKIEEDRSICSSTFILSEISLC
jgi:hypothetical protein